MVVFGSSKLKVLEYETGGIHLAPRDSFVGTIVVTTVATLDVQPVLDKNADGSLGKTHF